MTVAHARLEHVKVHLGSHLTFPSEWLHFYFIKLQVPIDSSNRIKLALQFWEHLVLKKKKITPNSKLNIAIHLQKQLVPTPRLLGKLDSKTERYRIVVHILPPSVSFSA